jgi:predicted TPR repeat methyltransferase
VVVSLAANNLGTVLQEQHDAESAKTAYQLAIDSYAGRASRPTFNLGTLLEEWGDVEGAKAAYQLVIDSQGEDAVRAAKKLEGLNGAKGF